ncbi:MAG: 3-phosphoserine/phosphohydroxythreonine transaminase [Enterobacteriaceae bacterium]
MNRVFNFSPGPSTLPLEILYKIKKDLYNWNNLGCSIMEISHRNKNFLKIASELKNFLIEIIKVPKTYEILFLHGGARAQFSAIPMNLLNRNNCADYINSGYWSLQAINEAKKYCNINISDVIYKNNLGKVSVKKMKYWNISPNTSYIHYCLNETANGISIYEKPNFLKNIIVADLSSIILSKNIKVKYFDVIYACSQKNIGIPGFTLVIIKKKIIKNKKNVPSFLSYHCISRNNSLFNTPSTFSWYVAWLICKWIKKKGGIKKIQKVNKKKAKLIYDVIDKNKIYINDISTENRSLTNIVFKIKNKNLEKKFFIESKNNGFYFLNGHKAIGGIRISLYNAMTIKGAKKISKFMDEFAKVYINF